jgi:hypothetical protein
VFAFFTIKKWVSKSLCYSILACVFLTYSSLPYFPLDKSTYGMVACVFILISLGFIGGSIFLFKKTKSKRLLFTCLGSIPFVLLISAGIMLISRTKFVFAPFEINALQVIKDRHKDVLFVSETDYNIKPIYKAVKPLLYENYHFGEKITGVHWEVVIRPEDNILKVSNYDNKVIVVPRYLGADLSAKEMGLLKLKKVFDNGQIAVFEKR